MSTLASRLAFVAVAFASIFLGEPCQADETSAYYARIDGAARKTIQQNLTWSGYYSGPLDGDVGRSSIDAIKRFQVEHGESPTGIMSGRVAEILTQSAQSEKNNIGFRYVLDRATGIWIGIPFAYTPEQRTTIRGTGYYSADQSIEIQTFALDASDQDLQTLYSRLKDQIPNRTVWYSPWRGNWFVLAGKDVAPNMPEKEFYIRAHTDGRQVRGFSIAYRPERYPRIATLISVMSFTFDPFPTAKMAQERNTGLAGPYLAAPNSTGVQGGLYAIKANDGFVNLRQGPGTNYPIVTSIPNGTEISILECRASQMPNQLPFCKAKWQQVSGWLSSCCIVPTTLQPTQPSIALNPPLSRDSNLPNEEQPPSGSAVDGTSRSAIAMKNDGGTYTVPVLVNGAITLDFVIDSGASDVSIPADVVMTLIRTGTITSADFIGQKTYSLADGSTVPSTAFLLRSLKVGNKVITGVTASVAPVKGSLLLGQSFLI